MSSVKNPYILYIDETGREEGEFADKFRNRKFQKNAITRWKAALERLRVGIMLKFPYRF